MIIDTVAKRVGLDPGRPTVSATIADEGPGLRQLDGEVFVERSDPYGHGIGLALARTLVTTEGGTISLVRAATPVFSIELPLA